MYIVFKFLRQFLDLKKLFLSDGGMHAREWVSPATVTYMMNKLITDNNYRDLIEKFDWYIV